MTSWRLRAAAWLLWLAVVPGVGCLVLSGWVLRTDPGFLFVVLPAVAGGLFVAGLTVTSTALMLGIRLHRGEAQARLMAAVVGWLSVGIGLFGLAVDVRIGLALLAYGTALVALVTGAGTDHAAPPLTEPWRPAAPWGQEPGTGPWSAAPVQQGPWSPPPTTVPWLAWGEASGPRPPWWQTWQAGLAQGVPLWELLLLVPSLLAFLAGLVAVLAGHLAGLLLVAGAVGVVALIERRMRERLERARPRPAPDTPTGGR